jgi:hypothetical protein
MRLIVFILAFVVGVWGNVNLTAPPDCYSKCLSDTLAEVDCQFADVSPFLFDG